VPFPRYITAAVRCSARAAAIESRGKTMIGSGAEPSGNRRAVQAGVARRHRISATCALASALLPALLLCGCAATPSAINPVDWYHDIEGGPIAAKRAPIPGARAPYPNLANVPQPPKLIAPAERDRISAELFAERSHAQQQAALAPVPPATNPSAGPAATSAPAGATSAAAPTSPPRAGGSTPGSVQAPAQVPNPASDQASPPPDTTLAAAAAALPSIPAAPPPPPSFAGFPVPGPPPAPFGLAQPARPAALTLRFPAGSAVLSAAARARLSSLAAARGKASIAVVGYGDATESGAAAQSAALQLGLARASTVAAALAADGVPASALRLGAEASGGGATLRLLAEPELAPATGT
jgi:outer membrane protein OmpA-like peptidoglycan-associated protein